MIQQSITEQATKPQRRNITFSAEDYYHNKSKALQDFECPICGDVNCLFKGFTSIGCRSCFNYFDAEELKRGAKQ